MIKEIELLNKIADRLRRLPGAFAVTPSHIDKPFPSIRFTFCEDDLCDALSSPNVIGAVHHGSFSSLSYPKSLFLFNERVAALAPSALGRVHLPADQLRFVLLGQITNWDELGFRRKAINLLAHGDPLHLRALCFLMDVKINHLSSSLKTYPTYAALRDAASSIEDVIVFGLRPAETCSDLRFIDVDDIALWDNEKIDAIPGQPISLVLPSRPSSREELSALTSYLQVVEQRAAADCIRLAQIKHFYAPTRARAVA